MNKTAIFFTVLAVCFSISSPAIAVNTDSLRIGITEAPPFVIIGSDKVSGICTDLWDAVTDSLKQPYRFVLYGDLNKMMEELEKGELDATINPLAITDVRLHKYRLSIPFHNSRMGIVERADYGIPLLRAMARLMDFETLRFVVLILLVVFIFAVLMWMAERKVNHVQFRRNHRGIFDGIWWAFVTMTTVGYGDKVPKTRMGRVLTIFWMLYAIAIFFVFTASISSEMTVTKMHARINSLEDLRDHRIGVLEPTGFADMLRINHIRYIPFYNFDSAIEAVRNEEIRAFVGDRETLQYLFSESHPGKRLRLYECETHQQYLCWGANHKRQDLIDRINPVLINLIETDEWTGILENYGLKP